MSQEEQEQQEKPHKFFCSDQKNFLTKNKLQWKWSLERWTRGFINCLAQRFYLNWSLTLKTKSCFVYFLTKLFWTYNFWTQTLFPSQNFLGPNVLRPMFFGAKLNTVGLTRLHDLFLIPKNLVSMQQQKGYPDKIMGWSSQKWRMVNGLYKKRGKPPQKNGWSPQMTTEVFYHGQQHLSEICASLLVKPTHP